MTLLSHPSDEQLSAFFDRQLPPDELTEIESHLSQCSDCTGVVADLGVLESWGPAIEERLPSDLYWQDLPERVLARIAREDRAPAVAPPAEAGPSWWRRLLTPGSTWAWLGATAAVAVVGGWFYLREDGPRETAAAVEPAVGGEVSTPSEDLPPGVPPLVASAMGEDEYRSRVATTLGMDGDMGEPLDVVPVVHDFSGADASGPVVRVGDASPVPPGAFEARDLLGTPELNYFFNSARRFEEVGRSDLAAHGYRILGEKGGQPDRPPHRRDRSRPVRVESEDRRGGTGEFARAGGDVQRRGRDVPPSPRRRPQPVPARVGNLHGLPRRRPRLRGPGGGPGGPAAHHRHGALRALTSGPRTCRAGSGLDRLASRRRAVPHGAALRLCARSRWCRTLFTGFMGICDPVGRIVRLYGHVAPQCSWFVL